MRPIVKYIHFYSEQLLNDLGVQPRVFNCNMEIDFDELIF